MKKTTTFALFILLTIFVGCSKDDDDFTPPTEIEGTWLITYEQTIYQHADGRPFREYDITEDDEDTDPEYHFVITNTTLTSAGEDGNGVTYQYTLSTSNSRNYITLDNGNEVTKFEYTRSGDEMTWRSERLNYVVEGPLGTGIIPKIIDNLRMKKQ